MTDATIVLAHGITRFDELPVALGWRNDLYFNGIAEHLRAHGFDKVEQPVVDFAAAVDVRAATLAKAISGLGPIHIIAHSMGGLDARWLIVNRPDAAANIRSLTTIGTPHRGTTFADWGLAHGGKEFTEFVERATRLNVKGFRDLTTEACRTFNESSREKESSNHVKYRVVSASEGVATTFGPLKFSHGVITAYHEGENDGLVSVASQRWSDTGMVGSKRIRRIEFPLPADHLNEVGWWDPAEALSFSPAQVLPDLYTARVRDFYLELARLAAAEG